MNIVSELRKQLFEVSNQLFLKCNLVNLMAFYGMLECNVKTADRQSIFQLN